MEEKLVVSLAAEDIICVGGDSFIPKSPGHCSANTFLPITNSMILTAISVIVISIMFLTAARGKLIPGRWQALIEFIVETVRGLAEGTITNKRVVKALFPLLATYLIFILLANWFSLIPGVGTIGLKYQEGNEFEIVPFLRGPNADLNMTLSMALVAIIIVIGSGIAVHGVGGWLAEFFPEPRFMDILLTPLEIIQPFTRILSLTFRLFGNIFAGEVLLAVIGKIGGFAMVIFLGLEFFVGFVQALVFALLTIVYVALATNEREGHGHSDHEHDEEHSHAEKKLEDQPQPQPIA